MKLNVTSAVNYQFKIQMWREKRRYKFYFVVELSVSVRLSTLLLLLAIMLPSVYKALLFFRVPHLKKKTL